MVILIQVWRTGHVPSDWKDGILIALYKGKGPKVDCSSYRPITLLSVPGKVFATSSWPAFSRSYLTRLPEQSGFVAGRSTIDAILALRLLSEVHREFDRPLNVVYLDIKAAFDSSWTDVPFGKRSGAEVSQLSSYRSNQRTSRWHSCPSARRTGTIGSFTHNLRGPTGVCSDPITYIFCIAIDWTYTAYDIATRDHRGPTTLH